MGPVANWMRSHEELARRLRDLRRVWPERDAERRRRALAQLAEPLTLHMELEEAVLMPAYAALADDLPANAAPRVFRSDHDKLRAGLVALADDVERVDPSGLLRSQERLGRLAGVLEHHDVREHTYLVPALDEAIDAGTAAGWIARFAEAEARLPPGRPLPPQPAPPPLEPPPDLDALDALKLAIACDGAVASALRAVPAPEHPRGPRRWERCRALVEAVEAAPTLEARRDRLAELADAVRLLAIVARSPRQSRGGG